MVDLFAGLMRAPSCVQAILGDDQAFDRLPTYDVRIDDLVHFGRRYVPIPDAIRINDDIWAVFALVETASLVSPDFTIESPDSDSDLE